MTKIEKFKPFRNKVSPQAYVLAILVALALIGGFVWWWFFYTPKYPDANYYSSTGQYDQGISALKSFIGHTRNHKAQARAYQDLATIEINKGDTKTAYQDLQQSASLASPNFNLLLLLGDTAKQLNDKTAAAGYYQQALNALNPSDPLYQADKAGLENQITQLNGSP